MFIKHLSLYLFVFFVSFASADDEVIMVDRNNERMNGAFQKAKKTVDSFLDKAAKRPEELSKFSAYVRVEDGEAVEFLWVVDVKRYDETYYMGVVVSQPGLVSNVKYGATIGYLKSDIYDWQYYDKEKEATYGAYTTCVLLDPESKEDERYRDSIGLSCKP